MSQLLFIFMEGKFIDLCIYGKLKEAKLLYEQHNIDIHVRNDLAFRYACEEGNLEIAKWLHILGAYIHVRNDLAFRIACRNGQLETAKWLYDLDANIHANDDNAFGFACRNGHLDIAKWLYDLGTNIHAKNDCAFRIACEYGQLETAKWLYDLGADIHAFGDDAFRMACMFGHLEIVEWLLTIDDFDVKYILNSHSYAGKIDKLLKQHLEYKLKWCNLFGFNKKCTKKFSDIYDNSKKEYSKTFDDMFPFSKVKN